MLAWIKNGQFLEVLGSADGAVDMAVWDCFTGPTVVVASLAWLAAESMLFMHDLLCNSLAPYAALLSDMMLKRDECTANDAVSTGQWYERLGAQEDGGSCKPTCTWQGDRLGERRVAWGHILLT